VHQDAVDVMAYSRTNMVLIF